MRFRSHLLIIPSLVIVIIVNLIFLVNNLKQSSMLIVKKSFYDIARWDAHEGPLLGYFLSHNLNNISEVVVFYPTGHDSISNYDRPFRNVIFRSRAAFYLYPGKFEEKDYEWDINPEELSTIISSDKTRCIKGYANYLTHCLYLPTDFTSKTRFFMYRQHRSIYIIPEKL